MRFSSLAREPDKALAPAAAPKEARLIACGSVDDGKSTLIGRLLWDTKTVKDDQAATLERDSLAAQNGLGLPDFALLLDGLQAEREQGITIDVAYRYFSTSLPADLAQRILDLDEVAQRRDEIEVLSRS